MAETNDLFRLVILLKGGSYVIINFPSEVIQSTLTTFLKALSTRSEETRWFRWGVFSKERVEAVVDLLEVQGYQCLPYEPDPGRLAAESVKRLADAQGKGDEWKT